MKAHTLGAVLTAAIAAAVLVSGCTSSLPFSATPTPKPPDLSAEYGAAFGQSARVPPIGSRKLSLTCILAPIRLRSCYEMARA
jgi:hypothetical protein